MTKRADCGSSEARASESFERSAWEVKGRKTPSSLKNKRYLGGIGRRQALKMPCSKERPGSSPGGSTNWWKTK